jgi:hypothetical protein
MSIYLRTEIFEGGESCEFFGKLCLGQAHMGFDGFSGVKYDRRGSGSFDGILAEWADVGSVGVKSVGMCCLNYCVWSVEG